MPLLSFFQAQRRHSKDKSAISRFYQRHAFKIVNLVARDSFDGTADERASHPGVRCETQLEQRISDVVIAKKKSGIAYGNELRGIVRLGSRSLTERDRFDDLFFHL